LGLGVEDGRTFVGKALKDKFVIADTGIAVIGYFNG